MKPACCFSRRRMPCSNVGPVGCLVVMLVVVYLGWAGHYREVLYNVYMREPIDSEQALLWHGDSIRLGDPRWQKVDNLDQAFVYAAHYDDVGSSPLVRIIGIALDPLPYFYVTCRYFETPRSFISVNVSGTISHLRDRNGRRYMAAFLECPLPDDLLPYALSVDQGNTSRGLNYMIINYSRQTVWTSPYGKDYNYDYSIDLGDSEGSDEDDVDPRSHDKLQTSWRQKNGRDASGFLWNVTRCFPALQKGYDDYVMLAECVAISRLLGVQHFVFYVQSAGPRVLAMLEVLKAQGDVEVHPWNMNLEEGDLYYAGQFSSINDCLYRHLFTSRYLLFGDVDEMFVQRDSASLMDLLEEEFTQAPECGAFLFLNVFFNLRFPSPRLPQLTRTTGTRSAKDLIILTHTRRHTEVLNPGDRSKPVLDPRKVMTGSVHVVQKLRHNFTSCVMDPSRGLMHHYRAYEVPSKDKQTDDPFLWGLYEEFAEEALMILEEYDASMIK